MARIWCMRATASGNWDIYFRRVDGQTAINLTENFEGDDHQPVALA